MCKTPATWPGAVEVLSVDLDIREAVPSVAEDRVVQAARELGSAHQIFLKVDSTLRGPIGAMVRGGLRGSRKPIAIVAPAFPEQGRLIIEGRLYVDGEPRGRVDDVLGDEPRARVVDDPDEVAAGATHHPEWLLVGSAGLARRLAGRQAQTQRPTLSGGPLLIVVGTPATATREQLQRLEAREDVEVLSTRPAEERDRGEAARALAENVADWARENRPRGVVLTGGATARAVCDRLGVHGIKILGEVFPGIPIGRLEGGPWDGVAVVTKAGAFGGPDTLLDVSRALS